MKKILLATTLLASTAGFAYADVSVTGTARMGVVNNGGKAAVAGVGSGAAWDAAVTAAEDAHDAYSDALSNAEDEDYSHESIAALLEATAAAEAADAALAAIEDGIPAVKGKTQFSSRVRIIFTASGETDNGLTFGASVRNDQSGVGNTANGDSSVWISGAFGKLTMGDTGNAADSLVGQVSGVGYTSLGSLNEISWLAKDTTGAMYEYSAGALSFAVGLGQTEEKEDFASAAVKYSTDAYSIALGYENNNSEGTQWSALGSATVSAATVKAKVAKADGLDTEYALSLDYAISGATVTGYYTHDYTDSDSYGLGASYDLGGGASVVGGVVNSDHLNDTAFDLGVKMSF